MAFNPMSVRAGCEIRICDLGELGENVVESVDVRIADEIYSVDRT